MFVSNILLDFIALMIHCGGINRAAPLFAIFTALCHGQNILSAPCLQVYTYAKFYPLGCDTA